jgi:AcrR family transcriptional regulator
MQMPRTRLPAAERRQSILSAASAIFAQHGFDGARTQQIAQAAGVSEALVFRHFSSKEALYRAVLRQIVRDQNESFTAFGDVEPSARGLLTMIERMIDQALAGGGAINIKGMRVVIGSLAGDGGYARLVYRRAFRLALPALDRAIAAACADGILVNEPPTAANAAAMIEHVATMMMLARSSHPSAIPYAGADTVLRRDAIRFCARGIGLEPHWIDQQLDQSNAQR